MASFDKASASEEGTTSANKYGAMVPKKKPLISKDHERAFFDSADWALCKQGAAQNCGRVTAVESLQPKLQRTPHQQLPPRRPTCTSGSNSALSTYVVIRAAGQIRGVATRSQSE